MDKWTLKKQRVHWAVNQSNLQWHLNLKVFLKNPSLKTWHGGWYTVRTADRTGVCLRYSHITESRSTCTSVSTQNKRDSYEWCYGADIRCCMVLSQDVWGEGRELWNCAGALGGESEKQLATQLSSASWELPWMPNDEVGTSEGVFIYVIRALGCHRGGPEQVGPWGSFTRVPPTHGPSAIWPEQLCFCSVSCVAFLSNILFKNPTIRKTLFTVYH